MRFIAFIFIVLRTLITDIALIFLSLMHAIIVLWQNFIGRTMKLLIGAIAILLWTTVSIYAAWEKLREPNQSLADLVGDIALTCQSIAFLVIIWTGLTVLWQIFVVRWRK